MRACAYAYMSIVARRGHLIPAIGVTGSCEHWCWELNTSPLKEQQGPLTAKQSLHPLFALSDCGRLCTETTLC